MPKIFIFFKKIANGNFVEKKKKIFVNFFEKNVKFLAIFLHSNGNFPEGQIMTTELNVYNFINTASSVRETAAGGYAASGIHGQSWEVHAGGAAETSRVAAESAQ